MNDKAIHPADAPLYPIREVSRLTGVNSVTLRAWERRYGLIRPRRTPKGHRLYARDDIARIERILQWLGRGVPVSQVRDLLDQPESASPAPDIDTGDWASQRHHLVAAVETLDLPRLEALFNQSLALYPINVALSELWQPAIAQLEEQWRDRLGSDLQRRVLESFLRTRVGTRLYHANHVARGPHLLISRLPDESAPLQSLLLALAASHDNYRVTLLDNALPFNELTLAVEQLGVAAIVLLSDQAERTELIRRHLPRLAEQLAIPVCLAGSVTRIRTAEFEHSDVELLGDDPVQSVSRLHPLLSR
ncbi:MAG: MerR family transcriptional regulator [Halomonas sp.]|nr:MerR family transcriptional regulator [Halomonas sp.]